MWEYSYVKEELAMPLIHPMDLLPISLYLQIYQFIQSRFEWPDGNLYVRHSRRLLVGESEKIFWQIHGRKILQREEDNRSIYQYDYLVVIYIGHFLLEMHECD